MMELSVVLPIYSETDSIRMVVEGLYSHLDGTIREVILVVHHASPRETFKICNRLAEKHSEVKILVQKSSGLGNAVREGLAPAEGTHVLMMDSDGEMLPETVPRMIAKIVSGDYDVVVASRWMKGGGAVGYTTPKYVFIHFFNWIFRFLFRTRIHDLSLGFKVMKAEVANSIRWEGSRHEIAAETTLRPIRLGYKVGEVPTIWVRRRSGESKNWMMANVRYIHMALRIWRGR